jgi:hypothetical protein
MSMTDGWVGAVHRIGGTVLGVSIAADPSVEAQQPLWPEMVYPWLSAR